MHVAHFLSVISYLRSEVTLQFLHYNNQFQQICVFNIEPYESYDTCTAHICTKYTCCDLIVSEFVTECRYLIEIPRCSQNLMIPVSSSQIRVVTISLKVAVILEHATKPVGDHVWCQCSFDTLFITNWA